jgi:hypothetical protein
VAAGRCLHRHEREIARIYRHRLAIDPGRPARIVPLTDDDHTGTLHHGIDEDLAGRRAHK